MQAVVLAAGAGARMGGPKARLLIAGTPLARLHVARLRAAGARRVVVVVRPEDESVAGDGVTVALSVAPDAAGSLARGLERLAPGDDPVVVTPVDALPASLPTIAALARAIGEGAAAAVPLHDSRRGHPVAVRAAVLHAGAREGRPLRDVLAALGPARVLVPVDDAAVLTDLDDPEELSRQVGGPPRFWYG